jgi:hypothetical protein
MIEQHKFQKRSWISTKKERFARKRKTVSSGIEAAASSKANNKAAEREQRGSRRGSFIHLLCDFPRIFFPFWKTPRFHEKQKDHRITTPRHKLREFTKEKNYNRKGAILATEK